MFRRSRLAPGALCLAVVASFAYADPPGNAAYVYDNLGRLRSVTYDDGSIQTYSYDDAGNRTSKSPDGIATVSVVANASVAEGSPVTLTLTRYDHMQSAFTLTVAASNGTAVLGTNYSAPSSTVSFASNQATATISLPTIRDYKYNTPLLLTVTIDKGNNELVVIRQRNAKVTVTNVDPAPTFSLSGPATHTEGPSALSATYTITKTNASALAHKVNFSTIAGTALPAPGPDYTTVQTDVSFAAGDTTKTVAVPITNDAVYGGTRQFSTKIASPTNGAGITAGADLFTTAISDDDPAPSFSIDNITLTLVPTPPGLEPISPAAPGKNFLEKSTRVFTVTKTNATRLSHSVSFTGAGLTATMGTDFSAPAGSPLTFASGETTKQIPVTSLDDSANEGNETFKVTLSAPTNGAVIGTSVGTATINENLDEAPYEPGPLTPNDIYTTGNIAVSWGVADGKVTRYELYKQKSDAGTQTLLYQGMNTSYSGAIGPVGSYALRVRACNNTGCSWYQVGGVVKEAQQ